MSAGHAATWEPEHLWGLLMSSGRQHHGRHRGGGHGPHGQHGCGGGFGSGFFGPWFAAFFGRGPRAERGDVRHLILAALAEQPRHGYQVIQRIAERTGGYRPSPGTVYPTLQLLEELGLVSGSEQDGKRVYTITDAGRQELEAHRDEVDDVHERLGWDFELPDPELFRGLLAQIRRGGRMLGRRFRRGGFDAPLISQIEAILREAADKLQLLLEPDRSAPDTTPDEPSQR